MTTARFAVRILTYYYYYYYYYFYLHTYLLGAWSGVVVKELRY